MTSIKPTQRRGRPPKVARDNPDTREALIRSGTAILTEQGFTATGIEGILKQVGVPKGSFYHYFDSKQAFGHAILDYYASYFARKLDRSLLDETRSPLQRIVAFYQDARAGMANHDFKRGCLVGNLVQEVTVLPEDFRERLASILEDWQRRVAACLVAAQAAGELSPRADCPALAEFFWIGWEGAVMRARLARSAEPLDLFIKSFLAGLPR